MRMSTSPEAPSTPTPAIAPPTPVAAPPTAAVRSSASAVAPSPATKYVFISYNWKDQHVAVKLNEDLKRRGYTTWLDIERAKESSLLGDISAILSNAFVIVALMSSSYNHSSNCRKELELSRDLESTTNAKIPLIPVIIESGFKPSPWLELFINGLSQYQCEDYSGLAKKLWSYMDSVNKQQVSSSAFEAKVNLPTKALVEWVVSLPAVSDQDTEVCSKFKRLSEELANEEERKVYAKDLLPSLVKLLQGSIHRNPRITKSILRMFLHYALDNSQAPILRAVLTEQFYGALDKIISIAGISDVWEACASLARDMQYLSTTGSLDSGKKKVMISYHWDAKVLASKMFDFFRSHATNWEVVDIENMSGGAGSGMEKTAAAIASCSALIIIVSPGYETSASCKVELMSAKKWYKPVIFVQPDQSYNGASSWLGFAVRDELCYDVYDSSMLEIKLSEIIKTGFAKVEQAGAQNQRGASVPGHAFATPALLRLPNVSMQTPEEVKEWLQRTVGLSPDSHLFNVVDEEELNGQCIRALAGMSVVDLKAILRVSKLSEVLKLKSALEDLY